MKKNGITKRAVEFLFKRSDDNYLSRDIKETAEEMDTFFVLLQSLFGTNKYRALRCFLERERLSRAVHSLDKNPDSNIEELSRKLGFNGVEEFESKFEEFFLVRPGLYGEYVKKRSAGAYK
ncbi:MAG: hypothetical protein KAW12_07495 [Candidatus Aminicenantes bacterium]|nr:hypothetical protein [Candidatus Aminicenantes bacterium]